MEMLTLLGLMATSMSERSICVRLPRVLVEKIREIGLDVESLVIDVIVERLSSDPEEEARIHVEIAEHFLSEAKRYIEVNDPVQASEKLYKVAEECIKALAIRYKISEFEKAREAGRWKTRLLDKAALRLSQILNEPLIVDAWDTAFKLHVDGFHEARLDIDYIRARLPKIEQLLKKTKELLEKQQSYKFGENGVVH